ncbi:MAG: methyltransferase domain-containing protein [Bacteriovoracaceae bacterium]|nr:methyltransferase domain-containing protein [Bacteriovoracaceae bacterium]
MLKQPLLEQYYRASQSVRLITYLAEYKLLHNFTKLFKPWVEVPERYEDKSLRPFLMADIQKLFDRDAQHFISGKVPWSLLNPESPMEHTIRYLDILVTGVKMSRLRKIKESKPKTQNTELPDYFVRNFHWQIDGYLTNDSAKIYDHQVEILFTGTASAMRRLALKPILEYLSQFKGKADILEIAAGTGELSHAVSLSCPDHNLTITDLSDPYLNLAKQRLKNRIVNFMTAASEDLPFKDQSMDIIYGVFLFHELPTAIRTKSLNEALRVLKPGGLFVLVDSIQTDDVPEYAWALEKFPQDYHEPFYKSFVNWPLKKAFEEAGFDQVNEERGFFSKCVWGTKPS